jgi:ADP-ribose pyrophosphatase YjhB (NUDIX family)
MADLPKRSGEQFIRTVPEGDLRERLVCADCGFINYENPKVVVGAVCRWQDRILLCRRAINPRAGYWTIPAGYMETRETTMDGAIREAWEEARARIRIRDVLAVYTIRRLSQVQVIFRAELLAPDVSAGPESREVALFRWEEIPWHEIAFPSVNWALRHDREAGDQPTVATRTNPPGEFGDFPRGTVEGGL